MAVKKSYYVDGNTVRQTSAPVREFPEVERQRKIKEENRKQRERQEIRRRAAQRNRERAMYMSPAYVAFLCVCVCLIFGVCATYIHLQSSISNHINNIAALENEVINAKASNDETLKTIETSVDLESIKYKAMHDLGMVYPSSSQIVYYSVDESDSMTQYSDIPEEKDEGILASLAK